MIICLIYDYTFGIDGKVFFASVDLVCVQSFIAQFQFNGNQFRHILNANAFCVLRRIKFQICLIQTFRVSAVIRRV